MNDEKNVSEPSPTLRVVASDDIAPPSPENVAPEEAGAVDETPEIDDFFAKSFALDDERGENDSLDAAFAGGLRSIFASEIESGENDASTDGDESDSERFCREIDAERRESLDGVLRQNDADFLFEAGSKYERPRVSDVDFERKSNGAASEKNADSADDESERRVAVNPTSILEAMLFVGDRDNKPLSLEKARELMRNVSETEALEALADLNERYFRNGSPYRIVRCGDDGFRLALLPEFNDFAARISGGKTKEFKLSQLAIDVLALIAYKQPITLDEILEVRNNAGSVLAQLVKRELISLEKRTVEKKKVAVYQTTPRFLKIFGLESLDDLPIVGDVDYR